MATTLTSLGSDHDMSVVRDNIRCFTSVSYQRIGEEVPLKARLVVRHLPLERTISRFPDRGAKNIPHPMPKFR